MNKQILSKGLIVGFIIGAIVAFIQFDLSQYFTLEYIKTQQDSFSEYYTSNPVQTIALYMVIYIAMAALSLPGAAILTLLGGALFGLVTGTIVVSFASTIGATCAFLVSRFLLKGWVQSKFGANLKPINDGIKKEGAFYLFSIRLIPAFPFFIVNLVMGLTPIGVGTFYIASQLGMLAGTAVYVNAGTELAKINSLKGILSPSLIFSFILLGIFPLAAKKAMAFIKKKK